MQSPPSPPPRSTPVTRTLPPIDVVVDESELPPASERPSKTLVISARDAEALRRIAELVPQTPVPEGAPRPSMPVRAAKTTVSFGKYSALVVGVIGLATELVRIWRPDHASVVGAIARALAQLVGAQ